MARRSTAENLRLRAEKQAARLESRRRDLRERYPHIPGQAWSNMGAGLGGDGGKALRGWLTSIQILANTPIKYSNDKIIEHLDDRISPFTNTPRPV